MARGASMSHSSGMAHSTIHVTPHGSTWQVAHEGAADIISEHSTATEAERVALEHARHEPEPIVVVHDRYFRSRMLRAPERRRTGVR
jgi:hypothetical protein